MPNLFGKQYSKQELLARIGDMSQLASVRKAELVEGRERGADLLEVFNASGLSFSVLPGRALDISSATYKGMSLCFRSSTGDVGPAFYEPKGSGWLRGFYGGLVLTCGMTFTGHPEVDPLEENEELGLHGRLSFLPARNVAADANWEGDDYVIRIRGKVRETVPFGVNLELTREITTVLGERSFKIHDRIENLGIRPAPLMFVYHCNPGFPVLDQGTRIAINSAKTTDSRDGREIGPERYMRADAPVPQPVSDVFVHRPRADADGKVTVGLVNDALKLGLAWTFPQAEMPLLNQWRHFEQGTYVTGIEPGNVSMLGRAWNRENGYLSHIQPGEARDFHLEIAVLDGEDDISALDARVARAI